MRLRPSQAQVKTVISFVEQHPEIAWKELRNKGTRFDKIKKLWEELSKIVNSLDGARKSYSAWMKFWQDKKRNVLVKNQLIKQGKIQTSLTSAEQRIIKLHLMMRSKRAIRNKLCNGDDNCANDVKEVLSDNGMLTNDFEEKNWNIMSTMIEVMNKQAEALTQIGRESLKKSEAMEQIAEASYRQSLAVDKLATIFDGFSGSLYEVRNAIKSINHTMKRCYPPDPQNIDNPIIY